VQPVLPTDPYLRALTLKCHKAAELSRLVRRREALDALDERKLPVPPPTGEPPVVMGLFGPV